MLSTIALEWLQSTVNATLALDPESQHKLAMMSGRVIRIHIKLLERELYLFPHEHGMDIRAQHDEVADTTISGTPLALLQMGLSKQVAPLLLKGDVSIEGNTALGREFKKLLATLDIDWEEMAARLVGDVPAHQLFDSLRTFGGWGRASVRSVVEDAGEYVQEESRDVVSSAELEHFYKQIDELRDDVARIEKDIERMTMPSSA